MVAQAVPDPLVLQVQLALQVRQVRQVLQLVILTVISRYTLKALTTTEWMYAKGLRRWAKINQQSSHSTYDQYNVSSMTDRGTSKSRININNEI